MTTNKTTHGGYRPGAGAKPTKARIQALLAENAELRAEIARLTAALQSIERMTAQEDGKTYTLNKYTDLLTSATMTVYVGPMAENIGTPDTATIRAINTGAENVRQAMEQEWKANHE